MDMISESQDDNVTLVESDGAENIRTFASEQNKSELLTKLNLPSNVKAIDSEITVTTSVVMSEKNLNIQDTSQEQISLDDNTSASNEFVNDDSFMSDSLDNLEEIEPDNIAADETCSNEDFHATSVAYELEDEEVSSSDDIEDDDDDANSEFNQLNDEEIKESIVPPIKKLAMSEAPPLIPGVLVPRLFPSVPKISVEDKLNSTSTPIGPQPRRRGRPTKIESARRLQEKIDRGEDSVVRIAPRRGRKTMTEEQKKEAKLKRIFMRRQEKLRLREEKRQRKIDAKEAKRKLRTPGVRRVLTEEEKLARDEQRRKRYEELKRIKMEKLKRRKAMNEEARLLRKKKREEEEKQRIAYDKRMQELKASFLDENTQMSATDGSGLGEFPFGLDETSQSSLGSLNGGGTGIGNKSGPRYMDAAALDKIKPVTAETLLEYRWPLEGKNSEYYFLQEQLCEYLDLKSFKRRYPDVHRRPVEIEEREFLVEMRVVNETQADLGLTAIPSVQVLDILYRDFYDKYDTYMSVVSERKDRNFKQLNYSMACVEKHKLGDFMAKAAESAAAWNKKMNQERREKRQSYYDLQTGNIHYPTNNIGRMRALQRPKLGDYPVALIPGQFCDHYRHYSSAEMLNMPLNTALALLPPAGKRWDELISSDGSDSSDSDVSSNCDSCCSRDSCSNFDDAERKQPATESEFKKQKMAIYCEKRGARCRICQGNNKVGKDDKKFLHCSKCFSSYHPTCIGLSIQLLSYVTSYGWECTDCKKCSKCHDLADEDKILFCDLCDRGYHIYCVGIEEVPSGRWHCIECSYCNSCGSKEANGGRVTSAADQVKWVYEMKAGPGGTKLYSHTMCAPCHKLWKKGYFCPICNVVFDREAQPELWAERVSCLVCSRSHHRSCVASHIFICFACQRRTQEKTLGGTIEQKIAASDSKVLPTTLPISSQYSKQFLDDKSSQFSPPHRVRTTGCTPRRGLLDFSGPSACDVCHKVYKNKSSLYSHKNRDHGFKITDKLNNL